MSIAGKLEMIKELLGKTEVHECDKCGETHEHVTPALITPEEALELLNGESGEEK